MVDPASPPEPLHDNRLPAITRFNPYAAWLQLPQVPTTYYQLLDIDPGSDVATIEKAAQTQLAKLRRRQIGQHCDAAQLLMNQVSTACDTLSCEITRNSYDQQLRDLQDKNTPASPLPVNLQRSQATASTLRESPTGSTAPADAGAEVVETLQSWPVLPEVPPAANCKDQLLICPLCNEWWIVSPQLSGRQILCIGCQSSLHVSADMCSLTPAVQPPPQPQPPEPPEIPSRAESAAGSSAVEDGAASYQPTLVELEDYAGQIVAVGAACLLILAVLLTIFIAA